VTSQIEFSNRSLIDEHFRRLADSADVWRGPVKRPDAPAWLVAAAGAIDRFVEAVTSSEEDARRSPAVESFMRLLDEWCSSFPSTAEGRVSEDRQALSLRLLAEFLVSIGELQRAEEVCTAALTESTRLGLSTDAARCELLLGQIYVQGGRWQPAAHWLAQACNHFEALHDPVALSDCLMTLGRLHHRRGEYDRAWEVYQRGLEAALRTGQAARIAMLHYRLGVLRRMKTGDEETFAYLREALMRFEAIGHRRGCAECLNSLGLLYGLKGLHREAVTHFEKSLELCRRTSYLSLMVFVHLHLSDFRLRTDHPELAMAECEKALQIIVRLRDPLGLAKANRIWGRLFWRAGLKAASELFYKESMLLYESLGIPLGQANCYLEFGEILIELKEWQRGLTYLSAARDLYRMLNLVEEAAKLDGRICQAEACRMEARRARPCFETFSVPIMME